MDTNKKISVVIPVYNEEDNLKPLYTELETALRGLDYELIFVDDGSSDSSWKKIEELCSYGGKAAGIKFSRNFGQTPAMKAGIKEASGSVIVTIDADLQNDPADIKKLLSELSNSCDLVSGWRKERKDDFFSRTLPSKIANRIISWVTGIELHDYGCSLKAYKAALLKDIDLYGEMHRFLPAIAGYRGASIKEIPVNHRPRTRGKSKYGIGRTLKVILDVVTVKFMGEFLSKPIYFFGSISIFLGGVSVFFALITLYNKLYNHIFVKDQPLFLVAIFIAIVGAQIGLIGLLSEITVRTYYSSSGRSQYSVREKIKGNEKQIFF